MSFVKRIGILFVLVILLVGCREGRDLRVPSDSIMGELLEQPGVIITEDWGTCEMESYTTLSEMAQASDCIIVAKVEKIWYEQRNGNSVLQMDVLVQQKFQGKLRAGDRVSIDYPGGYITYKELYEAFGIQDQLNKEYENMVSKMVYEGLTWPEEGKVYVLYINKSRSMSTKGLYQLTGTEAVLELQEDGNCIQQGTEDVYTLEEIEESSK